MDVYFYETFKEEEQALRQILPAQWKAGFTDKTILEAQHAQAPAPVISIRTQSRVPPEWERQLKGVFSRSKGYDHLAILKERGVEAGSLGSYCSRAVAESAFLMMLALLHKLSQQQKQFKTFCRDGIVGQEALGKKVLVVGVGDIGSDIARLCRGFEMNVRGVDVREVGDTCPMVSLAEGMAWAEILFVALPLTEQTRGLLNAQTVQLAQRGLILINVARGEITPFQDMKALLDQHHLGGLGMDVYEEESVLAEALREGRVNEQAQQWLSLAEDARVICTPHNAFNSKEALERKTTLTIEALERFFKGGLFL